jgi:hypothetical protein
VDEVISPAELREISGLYAWPGMIAMLSNNRRTR